MQYERKCVRYRVFDPGARLDRRIAVLGLELVVILGVAVLVCNAIGQRFRMAPPVLLLVSGALLGFLPSLREVQLPSEVVLLIFLPVLLYWESLTTSLREIRSNLRDIILMSTTLVFATAAAVAAVAHAAGLPWGPAWVLGAAVAPTDATAVGVLARVLPHRDITVLRAESLINDGTALVIYGVAVGITIGEEQLSALEVSWLFLLAYGGGALAGAVTAWVGVQVRRRLDDALLGNVVTILTPFTAVLLAQTIHASGVLAVVVSGLLMSQIGPRVVRADTRRQAQAFLSLSTFLINGTLFVLVGLGLQSAASGLPSFDLTRGLFLVGVVSAVVIGMRFVFLFGSTYLTHLLDRRPPQHLRRVSNRARVVSGVAGFRGAVSLAAALALPQTVASGGPFPTRHMIVFVTAGVIVVTLIVQGLLLPRVVRWARLPRDTHIEQERHLAETVAAEEALSAMPQIAAGLSTHPDVVERMRREYEEHMRVLLANRAGADNDPALRHDRHYTALRLALLAHKRTTVIRLRDEHRIDDTVLRQVQAALDAEEVHLSRDEAAD
jgi:CPA1 family monovalent cation:H+ antiporter